MLPMIGSSSGSLQTRASDSSRSSSRQASLYKSRLQPDISDMNDSDSEMDSNFYSSCAVQSPFCSLAPTPNSSPLDTELPSEVLEQSNRFDTRSPLKRHSSQSFARCPANDAAFASASASASAPKQPKMGARCRARARARRGGQQTRVRPAVFCEHCNRSFYKPSDLERHVRTHTGEKPFKCDQCGRAFRIKTTLQVHYNTHKAPGARSQFKCSICDLVLAARASLAVHLKLHTDPNPYACNQCDAKFVSSQRRAAHMKQQHGLGGRPGRPRPSAVVSAANSAAAPVIFTVAVAASPTGLLPPAAHSATLGPDARPEARPRRSRPSALSWTSNTAAVPVPVAVAASPADIPPAVDLSIASFFPQTLLSPPPLVIDNEMKETETEASVAFISSCDSAAAAANTTAVTEAAAATVASATNASTQSIARTRRELSSGSLRFFGSPCSVSLANDSEARGVDGHFAFDRLLALPSPSRGAEAVAFSAGVEASQTAGIAPSHSSLTCASEEADLWAQLKAHPVASEASASDAEFQDSITPPSNASPAASSSGDSVEASARLPNSEQYIEVVIETVPTRSSEHIYQCSKCDKSFANVAMLKRHQLTHTGQKPHKCGQCGKCFGQRAALTRHSILHASINSVVQYQCSQCEFSTIHRSNLYAHERNRHPTPTRPALAAAGGPLYQQQQQHLVAPAAAPVASPVTAFSRTGTGTGICTGFGLRPGAPSIPNVLVPRSDAIETPFATEESPVPLGTSNLDDPFAQLAQFFS